MVVHWLARSVLRNCKFKMLSCQAPKLLSTRTDATPTDIEKAAAEPYMIELDPSWPPTVEPDLRAAVLQDMQVYPEFVSEGEEAALLEEIEPVLKRMRYEYDHWDNAIQGYRETERVSWQPHNARVFDRVKRLAFPQAPACGDGAQVDTPACGDILPHTHVLDLAAAGHIKPHVDAVRFCGDTIAGLSLVSSAVMRLQHSEHKHLTLNALLPRRSLYLMKGVARYNFSHAVLGGEASAWRGERVARARRVALITRAKPSTLHTA